MKRTMLRLMNRERGARGLGRLRLSRRLSRYARRHTDEMIKVNYLFHSSPTAIQQALSEMKWISAAENVGVGQSIKSIHEAFMNSEVHSSNVLGKDFTHAGIGARRVGDTVWVTVVFYARG